MGIYIMSVNQEYLRNLAALLFTTPPGTPLEQIEVPQPIALPPGAPPPGAPQIAAPPPGPPPPGAPQLAAQQSTAQQPTAPPPGAPQLAAQPPGAPPPQGLPIKDSSSLIPPNNIDTQRVRTGSQYNSYCPGQVPILCGVETNQPGVCRACEEDCMNNDLGSSNCGHTYSAPDEYYTSRDYRLNQPAPPVRPRDPLEIK